jgi:hypothetical protein
MEFNDQELDAALARLRDANYSASAAVRAAVLAAAPARRRYFHPALALAAMLLVSVVAGWYLTRPKPAVHQSAQPLYTDFFPLSAVALDRQEPAHMVRIRLPRREMRRFGLPVSEEFERASIEADVLIGQDGIARAVRFVSRSQ